MTNLTTIFEDFLQSYQQRNPSKNTLIQLKTVIPAFIRFCMMQRGREFVEEITSDEVLSYLNSLSSLRTSSRKTHLRWITVFLHRLHNPMKLISSKPEPISYKGPPDIPRAIRKDLTTEEVTKILATLKSMSEKEKALGYFLINRLLRISELANLTVQNVNLEDQTITITKSKNGESRQITIPAKAYGPIRSIVEGKSGNDLVFGYKSRMLMLMVNEIFRKSGVEKRGRGSHAFRHSGIVALLEDGTNVAVVAAMAGNTAETIYGNYVTQISFQAQRNAEKKLDRLRKKTVV